MRKSLNGLTSRFQAQLERLVTTLVVSLPSPRAALLLSPKARRRALKGGHWKAAIMAIAAVFSLSTGIAPLGVAALGVDQNGVFLLNGKIINAGTAPPYTWNDLFNSDGTQKLTPNPHGGAGSLLNSAFVQDFAIPDNSYFTEGGAGVKDTDAIANWGCKVQNNPTIKDDILNAYAALFSISKTALGYGPTDTSPANHVVLFVASERASNNGDSFAGFWLFQNPGVSCDLATGHFTGAHTVGDILLLSNYTNGGGTQNVNVFKWVGGTNPLTDVANGGICDSPSAADVACAIANSQSPTSKTCDNVIGTNWQPGNIAASAINSGPTGTFGLDCSTFVEVGLDLTEVLGVGLPNAPCEEFAKFQAETRSSQQTSATLKDFAAGNMNISNCTTPAVATHNTPTTGTVNLTSYGDTAQITGATGDITGETVTFKAFGPYTTAPASDFCTGSSVPTPKFTTTGTLAADPSISGQFDASTTSSYTPSATGTYYWVAYYPSDNPPGHNNAANSGCLAEPFAVNPASTKTSTSIFDETTNSTVSGAIALGDKVHDTSTVAASPTPVGSVAYTFWTDGDCGVAESNAGTSAGGGPLVAGVAPNSNTEGPLQAGSYSFQATFTDSGNFSSSTSACEPLTVNGGTTTTATTICDAGSTTTCNAPSGTLGESVYDTSTVTPTPSAFTPTGSVAYTFYTTSTGCTGASSSAGGGALVSGVAPHSNTEGPLQAGSYSFKAVYTSGDNNYTGSTSSCEPLTIGPGTTNTATTICDAGSTTTCNAPSGALGESVYDTATVTPSDGFTPTGTVAYTFYTTSTGCTGASSSAGGGSLVSGVAPHSNTEGPLQAGSYSFKAVFTSGDNNYSGSTASCEPLTINGGTTTTVTTICDAGSTTTCNAPSGSLGESVYDTAAVTPSPTAFTPTGSVAYTFYTASTSCTGASTSAGGGTLVSGAAPHSNTEGPLAAGSYSFKAVFTSADNNYTGSTATCEPLTIGGGTTITTTTICDAGSTASCNAPTGDLGESVYDTSSVTPSTIDFTPTGSVAYTFFTTSSACTGPSSSAGGGALVSGVPPRSSTEGPLEAGSYSFQATYTSGDSNFTGSTSTCEPLTINQGTSATSTSIFDETTGSTVSGAIDQGDTVHDTSTVTGTPPAFTPTGTVTYTFWTNGDCGVSEDSSGTSAGGGSLVDGAAPNSSSEGPLTAGSYSFDATYSGDRNYSGSTSSCEPLTVVAPSLTLTKVTDGLADSDTSSATVPAGTPLNFDITFANTGPGIAHGTVLSDPLRNVPTAANSGWILGTVTGTGAVPSDLTCAISNATPQVLTCGAGSLLSAFDMGIGSVTVEVSHATDGTSVSPTAYANTASASSTNFNNNLPITATASEFVESLTTAASGPVNAGQGISDVATVHGGNSPTGTVTFALFGPNDSTCSGTNLLAGNAAFTVPLTNGSATSPAFITGSAPGTYQWVATYNGDSNNPALTGKCGDAGEQSTVNALAVAPLAETGDWTVFTIVGVPLVLIGILLLVVSRRRREGEA